MRIDLKPGVDPPLHENTIRLTSVVRRSILPQAWFFSRGLAPSKLDLHPTEADIDSVRRDSERGFLGNPGERSNLYSLLSLLLVLLILLHKKDARTGECARHIMTTLFPCHTQGIFWACGFKETIIISFLIWGSTYMRVNSVAQTMYYWKKWET